MQIIIRSLWLGEDLKTAIDARRLHHQLIPMKVLHEQGVQEEILKGLEERSHTIEKQDRLFIEVFFIHLIDSLFSVLVL